MASRQAGSFRIRRPPHAGGIMVGSRTTGAVMSLLTPDEAKRAQLSSLISRLFLLAAFSFYSLRAGEKVGTFIRKHGGYHRRILETHEHGLGAFGR